VDLGSSSQKFVVLIRNSKLLAGELMAVPE